MLRDINDQGLLITVILLLVVVLCRVCVCVSFPFFLIYTFSLPTAISPISLTSSSYLSFVTILTYMCVHIRIDDYHLLNSFTVAQTRMSLGLTTWITYQEFPRGNLIFCLSVTINHPQLLVYGLGLMRSPPSTLGSQRTVNWGFYCAGAA